MSRPPDDMYRVSEALYQVMDDIGVNEMLVKRRRRTFLLKEAIVKICPVFNGTFPVSMGNFNTYHFGSQTEGSTTLGLHSDIDILTREHLFNLIQNLNEWKHLHFNYMMIYRQNENISPGYCYLQFFRTDLPLPATFNHIHHHILMDFVIDSEGRLLWKNDSKCFPIDVSYQKHGPAIIDPTPPGMTPTDEVTGFFCQSLPHQVTSWLESQKQGKWPTEDVLKDCRNAGCFVVPLGSKIHSLDILESKLEWRISTSLQERYLMFSLNIPQLMCYVLIKMILKTHIYPHVDVLSSFMCKNVLLFCIANSSHNWHTGNLLAYLHLCLFMLKECIKQRNCPHFIIQENNLLAGHMTDIQRGKLLDKVNTLMQNDEQLLFAIEIDDLGRRLKMKLNMIPYCPDISSSTDISVMSSLCLVGYITSTLCEALTWVQYKIKDESKAMAHQFLSQTYSTLQRYICSRNEEDLKHTANELLIPLVSSSLGSVMASISIESKAGISDEAFTYLEAGKESDALSGRLKLVSVLYCTGDMERAERELNIIQTQYKLSEVHTVCGCYKKHIVATKLGGRSNFEHCNIKAIKSNIALCTRFLQCEINCVPRELRYEILRSYIDEDTQMRTLEDCAWMDLIVVDSIPYLYFLQYKLLKAHRGYEHPVRGLLVLHDLIMSNISEPDLHHEETSLNLLGQCYEQENMQRTALLCYTTSLQFRKRNNAARFLLCIQLFKLWKRDN